MFEAVIFDWDGTLADTREVVVTSFQTVLKDIGCNIPDAFIARRIGIGTAQTFEEALNECKKPYDDLLLANFVRRKVETAVSLAWKVKLFIGVSELLKELKTKLKLALASMNNREVIEATLRRTGLTDFFAAVLTADEVVRSKPDPEIFIKAAAKIGVESSQCAVFEDSIFGVEAAKRANMACVAVTTGSYSASELSMFGPDLIVTSLGEKERILKYVLQ